MASLKKLVESILKQNAKSAPFGPQEPSSQQSSRHVVGVDFGTETFITHFTIREDGTIVQNYPLEPDSQSWARPQDTKRLVVANPSSDPQDDSSTVYYNITTLPERK